MNPESLAKMLASNDRRDVKLAVDILHQLDEEEYKLTFWRIHMCYSNGVFASHSWFFEDRLIVENEFWAAKPKSSAKIYLKIPTNENKILVYYS